jgi:serine protease AprX
MPDIGGVGTRWRRRLVAAAALPMVMAGAVIVPSAAAVTAGAVGSGGWAGNIWMGDAGSGNGTPLRDVRTIIGADTGAAASLTGQGVGVALIDTGVAAVPGLPAAQIVNGPDLSFESQKASLRYLDSYGHGTHMAGIIVGNDIATGTKGLAPKAKLTSIKVGTANGAVDVTQIIAAIDWVVEHRNDDPANPIRVINLSYGSGGQPPYWTDPVQYAAEQAWKAGIVVVAAVGNNGNDFGKLTNPARDPFVIGVGAASTKGTVAIADDWLTTFTNLATQDKQVDLLAPGESIVSLRDPGSNIDAHFASARVGATLFRGSGTSQAAAVTSAAAALLLQAKPSWTPDKVKAALKGGTFIPNGKAASMGLRMVNVNAALASTDPGTQSWMWSTGTGTLEEARGPSHVVSNNVNLTGEKSVFGAFSSATWAPKSANGTSWNGGAWLGTTITGSGWTGTSWASKTWAAATWTFAPWGGGSGWSDPSWNGRFWSNGAWVGGTWVGRFWSSDDWSASFWG